MPSAAAELRPEEARHFIVGKYFTYTCSDGTACGGRIYADESVLGTLQAGGCGPIRFVALPTGTIRVQRDSICASLPRALVEPGFTVNQIDSRSFRGAITGLPFAYCDFIHETAPGTAAAATKPRKTKRR
jgi:hypothetical protein